MLNESAAIELPKHPNFENLTNLITNFLEVKSYAGRKGCKHTWNCKCLYEGCGNETVVASSDLKSGHTKSCGCYGKTVATTHGKCKSPEYQIWCGMIGRCYNEKREQYPDYGGRGIIVCDRWLSFENFYADMGSRPSLEHSVDRKDNGGNYCPENCYWATKVQQNNNTRRNRFLTHNGKTQTVSQWAREIGISITTLHQRIFICKWTVEKALTTPVRKTAT
jgi:hypothetical protein